MVTLNPAWQLGVDKRVGSIEVGKDADIAIFSAHPFDPATRVEMTLVDGIVYFDRAHDDGKRATITAAKRRSRGEGALLHAQPPAPGGGGGPAADADVASRSAGRASSPSPVP